MPIVLQGRVSITPGTDLEEKRWSSVIIIIITTDWRRPKTKSSRLDLSVGGLSIDMADYFSYPPKIELWHMDFLEMIFVET